MFVDARGAGFLCAGEDNVWLQTQGSLQEQFWGSTLQVLPVGAPDTG